MALQWDISYVLCGCAQTPLATSVPENYVLNISYHMVIYVGSRDVSSPLQMSHQTLGHVHLQHTKHDGIYIPLSVQGLHLGDTGASLGTSCLTKVFISAGRMPHGLLMLIRMLLKMLEAQKILSRLFLTITTTMFLIFHRKDCDIPGATGSSTALRLSHVHVADQ